MISQQRKAVAGFLGVVLGTLGPRIAGGEARDLAEAMPAGTLAYIGWADVLAAAGETDALTGIANAIIESEMRGDEAVTAREVVELALRAARGSGGIGLFDVIPGAEKWDIQLGLVIDVGAETARFAERVDELYLRAAGAAPQRVEVAGEMLSRMVAPRDGFELYWGFVQSQFIAAAGPNAAKKLIAGLKGGGGGSLADSAELKLVRGKTRAGMGAGMCCAYADLAAGWKKFYDIMTELEGPAPPFVDRLVEEGGVQALRSLYVHMTPGADGHAACFVHTAGPLKGILKFWDQKPLRDDDLKLIPSDAYWAEVWNLDLHALWKETLRIVEEIEPDYVAMVEGGPAMLAPMLGFSITDDFLPALGDTWAVYDAPAHGGVLLTGTVLAIETRRANDVRDMLGRVLTIATGALATARAEDDDVPALVLKEAKYGPHTVQYALLGGLPAPVAPAWAFAGDRWVIGLWPQTVAAALRQIEPATRGPSLLDHPDVQAARAKLPEQITGFGYVDARGLQHLGYPLMTACQTAMASMAAGPDAAVDLGALPTLPEVLAGTRNSVSVSATEPDGFLYLSTGGGSPFFVIAGTAAVAAGALLPALVEARGEAQRVRSAVNLRLLAQACQVHAAEHGGRFPARIEDVAETYAGSRDVLTAPYDSPGTVSYVYIDGQKDSDHAENVLLYERIRAGRETHAVFLDGHVRRMTAAELTQEVRATYARLKREAELPAEFR